MLPQQFTLDVQPVASSDSIVRIGCARFTILTERLIRLEYDENGVFEDRATQTVWYRRRTQTPAFTMRHEGGRVVIETAAFTLHWTEGQPFSAETLSIHVKATDSVWYPGTLDPHNLKGTTRTLDFNNGYIPLNDGLISRSGWSLLDDSRSFILNGDHWLEPRTGTGTDWYFFAYGHDYKAALRDYCAISGAAPLIPRWILGNWWSRYWAYTQDELVGLIEDFKAHEIPLSVCIVDMDWHITETGNRSSGWTGYTWNRKLFPDPQALLDFFHANGLRTALNLHPADGVHPHEEQYPEMARRMGVDPESKQPIPFDITDPTFVQAYFEVLHHPYEAMGVDFWWVDWQQGQSCNIPALDPLWLINHLHFYDAGRDASKRPFIFSRWGNEGHQRYPIGFSGDSYMTWETLRFQPYMTATASNVAYGWWSHDIGGHISGMGDAELFARWVQFGVFSPVLRIHSAKGHFYDQRPWAFGDANVRDALRAALQLRHALIPYLYTMAWRAHDQSLPLMLPMYYDYPEHEAAYHCPGQYLFGSKLTAAPFTEPADPHTGLSRQVVWLPPGDWYHVFTGEYYEGDRWYAIYGTLKDIPVFAQAGAILPMGAQTGWGGIDNPTDLHLHVFAGAEGEFVLYEDDGGSRGYVTGDYCQTRIEHSWADERAAVTICPASGTMALIPAERVVHLHVRGVAEAVRVEVMVNDAPLTAGWHYDSATESLILDGITLRTDSTLTVRLWAEGGALLSRRERKREKLLGLLRSFKLFSGARNRLADNIDALIKNPDEIAPSLIAMQDAHVRALCELLYDAGMHVIRDAHDPVLLIVWNNRADEAITYRYGEAFLQFGGLGTPRHEHGVAPRFHALVPEFKVWSHGTLGTRVHQTQWQLQMDYHGLASVSAAQREESPE